MREWTEKHILELIKKYGGGTGGGSTGGGGGTSEDNPLQKLYLVIPKPLSTPTWYGKLPSPSYKITTVEIDGDVITTSSQTENLEVQVYPLWDTPFLLVSNYGVGSFAPPLVLNTRKGSRNISLVQYDVRGDASTEEYQETFSFQLPGHFVEAETVGSLVYLYIYDIVNSFEIDKTITGTTECTYERVW